MKTLGQIHSEYKEYNYRTWLIERIEVNFQFLGTRYKCSLFMFQQKKSSDERIPYLMLENVDSNEVILRASKEIDSSAPFDDHSDEITESLWDDCMDWISSHV